MFREIRRSDRKIDEAEAVDILKKAQYGVLSTVGADGYCYGIPLNYVLFDDAVYFHCASEGHKLDNLRFNDKVSFCAVAEEEVLPGEFTTRYQSAVVFGAGSEVFGEEKEKAFTAFIAKYCADNMEEGKQVMKKAFDSTKIIKIHIEHLSGKAKR